MPRRLREKSQHQERRSRDYRRYGRPVQLEQLVRPSPVKEGEEYETTIEDVGSKGDGLCNIVGFKIYVRGATTGERVKIRITGVMGGFATADVVERLK
jgi:predicted RNA-binding protein with TRAM domain